MRRGGAYRPCGAPSLRVALSSVVLGAAACLASLSSASCAKPLEQAQLIPEDYLSWRLSTDRLLEYPIPGHEMVARVIYINDAGLRFESTSTGASFPDGTVIVKELRPLGASPRDEPSYITAMIKAPEDGRSLGGWLWVMRGRPDGVDTVVRGDFCYRCHKGANEPHPYADGNPTGSFRDGVFYVPGLDRGNVDE